jgi:glucan phosphoethanolaminetransferase (alkaline phosphatase superfamily)
MSAPSERGSMPPDHNESSPRSLFGQAPATWQAYLGLAKEGAGLINNLLELTALELLAALKTLPKIIATSLCLLFFVALAWISLCVGVSWWVSIWLASVGAGLLCFFVIQLFMIVTLLLLLKKYRRSLSLPNSRAQFNQIAEVLHDTFAANRTEEK